MKTLCIAILNYNGKKHLEQLLPTVRIAVASYPGDCAVLILDNGSTEDDVQWLRREFPEFEAVVAPKNDFLFSYNWLAAQRPEDILVILNNDLKLRPDFLSPLARHFVADDVFAAGATSRDWDDETFTWGPIQLRERDGIYRWRPDYERQELCHTLYCSGGFVAVDRKKFLELGGFNRLFSPAYAEDLDLCFRAWRKGWRCIFEPSSVVLHRERGSWDAGGDNRAARLCLRADLFFQWASLPPPANWLRRSRYVFQTAFDKLRRGKGWWLRVWMASWFEWRRRRKNFKDMMTPPQEMNKISSRIAEPVLVPVSAMPFANACRPPASPVS